MSNYPDGAINNSTAPFNEKKYNFEISVSCTGSLNGGRWYYQDLEDLKEKCCKQIKSVLEDEVGSILVNII